MKKRKFASGGAMGGLDTISEGARQISESLGEIGQGLNGGGGGGMTPNFGGDMPLGLGSQSSQDGIQKILSQWNGQGLGPNANNFSQSTAAEGMQNLGFKKGGKVSSASKRGDGIAKTGKTRGRMC
jgi:hypothetical protein